MAICLPMKCEVYGYDYEECSLLERDAVQSGRSLATLQRNLLSPATLNKAVALLYLYRARNKITQLSIPTHAQLHRHRLKFILNHLKNSYMFRSSIIFRELQCPR